MEQFKVTYTEYSEAGAETNNTFSECFTNASQAKDYYEMLNRLKQGNGMKKYKVTLQVATYKTITDVNSFFALFEV